jgi:hypothetical protein
MKFFDQTRNLLLLVVGILVFTSFAAPIHNSRLQTRQESIGTLPPGLFSPFVRECFDSCKAKQATCNSTCGTASADSKNGCTNACATTAVYCGAVSIKL